MTNATELLKRAYYCWVCVDALEDESDPEVKAFNDQMREIGTYLFTHSDAAEKEAEPVAWLCPDSKLICSEIDYDFTITEQHPKNLGWIPLYASSVEPARNSMSEIGRGME